MDVGSISYTSCFRNPNSRKVRSTSHPVSVWIGVGSDLDPLIGRRTRSDRIEAFDETHRDLGMISNLEIREGQGILFLRSPFSLWFSQLPSHPHSSIDPTLGWKREREKKNKNVRQGRKDETVSVLLSTSGVERASKGKAFRSDLRFYDMRIVLEFSRRKGLVGAQRPVRSRSFSFSSSFGFLPPCRS